MSDIQFSADGTLVGTVSGEGELIVWDTATGRPVRRWRTADPFGVGFGPDNRVVYGGAGAFTMLRSWDLSLKETYLQRVTQAEGDHTTSEYVQMSPDGDLVAHRWLDARSRGWVRLLDTATGRQTQPTRLPI